jgi:hypothetical protein
MQFGNHELRKSVTLYRRERLATSVLRGLEADCLERSFDSNLYLNGLSSVVD